MRLIDADAFFNDFPEMRDYEYASQEYEVDAVEVVRCRDCTSFYSGWCCDFGIHMDDNEFCSGGERRED